MKWIKRKECVTHVVIICLNNYTYIIIISKTFSPLAFAIHMTFGYRASKFVIVISLVEDDWFLLDKDVFFPAKKPGSLGLGNELPIRNIITTYDMLGWSSDCCCKHKKLMWRQRTISNRLQLSSRQVSINSKCLPSFHNFHA